MDLTQKTIQVRYDRSHMDRFIVYFDGKRMGQAQLLQLHVNAHLISKKSQNENGDQHD